MGRMNRLISPFYGGALRIEGILTDLPLALDKPIDFSLQEYYCRHCRKCAKVCPVKSIGFEKNTTWELQSQYSLKGKRMSCMTVRQIPNSSTTLYKGKRLAVIGGNNSGFDETEYLMGLGVTQVTIVEMLEECPADQATIQRVLKHPSVELLVHTQLKEPVLEEGRLTGLVLENLSDGTTRSLDVDGVFVFVGQHPNTQLFTDQITLTDSGYVDADRLMNTNLAGVFAAGDVVERLERHLQ